jgi:hypothetical protein
MLRRQSPKTRVVSFYDCNNSFHDSPAATVKHWRLGAHRTHQYSSLIHTKLLGMPPPFVLSRSGILGSCRCTAKGTKIEKSHKIVRKGGDISLHAQQYARFNLSGCHLTNLTLSPRFLIKHNIDCTTTLCYTTKPGYNN